MRGINLKLLLSRRSDPIIWEDIISKSNPSTVLSAISYTINEVNFDNSTETITARISS